MSFEDVWGQDRALGFLRGALARGRVAHAFVFVGPTGVGRRLTARELAKALLCEEPDSERGACDACSSCRRLSAGTHPDYFELGRQTGKQVVEIDRLREFLRPMERRLGTGERRVFTVDDAELFRIESYNLVLKRLEEPPPGNFIILVTQSLDALPATVVSRAQVVRFVRLAPAALERVLTERCGLAKDEAREAVPLLLGSAAPATEDLQNWLAEHRWVIETVCGMEPGDEITVAEEFLSRASQGTEGAVERNLKASELLRPLVWLYRDALVLSRGGGEDLLSGVASAATLEEFVEKRGTEGLGKGLANLVTATVELVVSNPAVRLSELFVELMRRPHGRVTPVVGR